MASEVSFSPHFLGGAGFFHLYDEQGYGQVKLFMKTWQSHETLQGQLLCVSLAWAQYTAGTGATIKEEEQNQSLRKNHMDNLASAYKSQGDKKMAAIIQRIKQAEATKKVYAKCRAA